MDLRKQKAKEEAQRWAREILCCPDVLYIDLETNRLPKDKEDRIEIIQLALVNQQEHPVFVALLAPIKEVVSAQTREITGIDPRELIRLPNFADVSSLVTKIIRGKRLVSFNADFDITQLKLNYKGLNETAPYFTFDCAMLQYSKYCGKWDMRRKSWSWQRLPKLAEGEAHGALVDCVSTKRIIEVMAGVTSLTDGDDVINLSF